MRQLRHVLLNLGLALAVVTPVALSPTDAVADARSDARNHYQQGVKLYNAGDYKGAIREFSSAQSLMPADLNNYNLALCYDKLGDAEPAIQYYKAYLDKVPNTDKRAEIEASVQRLDAALKSSAAKKAEEARKAEEAKKQLEAKKAEEDRKKAEEDAKRKADEEAKRKADEDAKRSEEAKPGKDPYGEAPPVGPVAPARPANPVGGPGNGQRVQPTGDPQLDRVQGINIDQIRDERVGGSGSGIPTRQRPPARVGTSGNGNVNGSVGVGGGVGGGGPAEAAPTDEPRTANDPRTAQAGPQTQTDPNAPPTDQPKPAVVPVYKKWWFWAVVAVSAYVVYSIASEDSKASTAGRTMLPPLGTGGATPHGGGFSLFRF